MERNTRRCHRLGDDFVGCLPRAPDDARDWAPLTLSRTSEELPWVRPGEAQEERCVERCYCRPRRSPRPPWPITGGGLKSFSPPQLRRTVLPTSCGCQEANTTYCYFTTRITNQVVMVCQTEAPARLADFGSPHQRPIPRHPSPTLVPHFPPFNAYSQCSYVDSCGL